MSLDRYAICFGKIEEINLKNKIDIIFQKNNLKIEYYIDHDPNFRLSTFNIGYNRYCRFYHLYGILIIYKYDKPLEDESSTLIDMLCYKFNTDLSYRLYNEYIAYCRSIILFYLPFYFNELKRSYKLLFISSTPPFKFEGHAFVRQESCLYDDYDLYPIAPRFGFIVLTCENKTYICRVTKDAKFVDDSNQSSVNGIPYSTWVSNSHKLLALEINDFYNRNVKWDYLDYILTKNYIRHPKAKGSFKKFDDPLMVCEKLSDLG